MFNEKNLFNKISSKNQKGEQNKDQISEKKENENKDIKSLTKEDILNHEYIYKGEKPENLIAEIPEKIKGTIRKIADRIPESAKQEVIRSFKYNVNLIKEFSTNIKEKINWKSVDKKVLAALGVYFLGSVLGGVLEASEVEGDDDTTENFDNDDLNEYAVKATIFNAMDDLSQIDGFSTEAEDLFIEAAVDLGSYMQDTEQGTQDYQFAVKAMVTWSQWAQEHDADIDSYKAGLINVLHDFTNINEAKDSNLDTTDSEIDDYQAQEQEESGEFGSEGIGITLPEKFDLEFSSHFSETEKAQIQNCYNDEVETIHEAAEQMSNWGEKYGDKPNWDQFETSVKNWLQDNIGRVNSISEDVAKAKPGDIFRAYQNKVGDIAPADKAELRLNNLSDQARLRSTGESMNDAFNEL